MQGYFQAFTSDEARDLLDESIQQLNQGAYWEALATVDWLLKHLAQSEVGDRTVEGAALSSKAQAQLGLRQYDQAIDTLQQTILLARELKDALLESVSLIAQGGACFYQRDFSRAIVCYSEALSLAQTAISSTANLPEQVADAWRGLGCTYRHMGKMAQAIAAYLESLTAARHIADAQRETDALHGLALTCEYADQFEEAICYYEAFLQLKMTHTDRSGMIEGWYRLGHAHELQQDYAKAVSNYQESLAIAEEMGDRANVVKILLRLGYIYQTLEQYEAAIDVYQRVLEFESEAEDFIQISQALYGLGRTYEKRGDAKQALRIYQQILTSARKMDDAMLETTMLVIIADVERHL